MFKIFIKSFSYLLSLVLGLGLAVLLLLSICFGLLRLNSGLEVLPDSSGVKQDLGKNSPLILEINIHGIIAASHMSVEKISDMLSEITNGPLKNRVKGILLCINSPGGEVFSAYRIYSLLSEWKSRTLCPVYAYVEGLCASGAYYISCAADKIFTNDLGLTGSIGVISGPFFNVKEALKTLGIDALTLTAGRGKAGLSPFTEWTDAEKKSHQDLLDFFYSNFLDLVLKNRKKLTQTMLVNEIGSEIFPPQIALNYGLVDNINMSRADVLFELTKNVGIQDDYRVIGVDKEQLFKRFFTKFANSPVLSGTMKHEIVLQNDPALDYEFSYVRNR